MQNVHMHERKRKKVIQTYLSYDQKYIQCHVVHQNRDKQGQKETSCWSLGQCAGLKSVHREHSLVEQQSCMAPLSISKDSLAK